VVRRGGYGTDVPILFGAGAADDLSAKADLLRSVSGRSCLSADDGGTEVRWRRRIGSIRPG
jgi:hypothetical protein